MATKGKELRSPKGGLDVYAILEKYYQKHSQAHQILTIHSECVAKKALEIARRRKEWKLDKALIYEGTLFSLVGSPLFEKKQSAKQIICSSRDIGTISRCGKGRFLWMIISNVIPTPVCRSQIKACLGSPSDISSSLPITPCLI